MFNMDRLDFALEKMDANLYGTLIPDVNPRHISAHTKKTSSFKIDRHL
jgi:hypothetical protein